MTLSTLRMGNYIIVCSVTGELRDYLYWSFKSMECMFCKSSQQANILSMVILCDLGRPLLWSFTVMEEKLQRHR